jgi:hypothetical protein
MGLAHFFIDHPRFAAVINIFIMVFGLAAAAFLPVAQYPNIVPPTVQITASYPGAAADVVARTVATPLEQAINGVENMDYISSQSTGNGQLNITVIFKIGTDINTALMLTHNRVQDTLSRLPQEVQLQGVQVKKTIPALLLGVFPYSPDGSRSAEYISNYMILHVKDEIARLPGVADFWVLGERQYAMRIWIPLSEFVGLPFASVARFPNRFPGRRVDLDLVLPVLGIIVARHRICVRRRRPAPRGGPAECQVIECASKVVRLEVVAPAMLAMATPAPPLVAEIDSTAPLLLSTTLRYFDRVAVVPIQFVDANAERRSSVSPAVKRLLVNASYPLPAAGMT